MKIYVKKITGGAERVIKSLVLYGALSIRTSEEDFDTECVEIGRDDVLFSFGSFDEAHSFSEEVKGLNGGLSIELGAVAGDGGAVVRVREMHGDTKRGET